MKQVDTVDLLQEAIRKAKFEHMELLNRSLYGDDQPIVLNRWEVLLMKIKYQVKRLRMRLGEIIAGEYFDY